MRMKWSDAGKVFNTAPCVTRAVMNNQRLLLHTGGGRATVGVWPEGCGAKGFQIRLCLLHDALVLVQA